MIVMMKKYSLLLSFFLGTTCLFVPTFSQAAQLDEEDLSVLYESRSEFVKYKERKALAIHRLSDKGDYNTEGDSVLRRCFFTPQDADSLFSALGLTRQAVAQQLLEKASNIKVRLNWQEAIY